MDFSICAYTHIIIQWLLAYICPLFSFSAIGWCSIGSKSCVHDVTVSGRKQGVTAKLQDKPLAW